MNCFYCGNEIEEGAKFCKYCGRQLDTPVKMTPPSFQTCMICGAKLKTGDVFCTQCGAPISDNPRDPEIERKGNHRFLIAFLIFSIIIFLLAGISICWIHFFNNPYEESTKEDSLLVESTVETTDHTSEPPSQDMDIVEYTVICVDDSGNTLLRKTYSGAMDKEIIVKAPEIDGYIPKQETLSVTLSYDPSDNIVLFVYSANDVDDETASEDTFTYPDDAMEYQGHHYYIFDYDGISWNDVVQRCQELGGYPAVINDAAENTELYQYMLETNHEEAYFGLTMNDDGDWEYPLGDTSAFRDWGINSKGVEEPNNDGGNERNVQFCVHMHDGFWNDATFGRQSYTPEGKKYKNLYTYICEWDY